MGIGVTIICTILTLLIIVFITYCGFQKWRDKSRAETCPITREQFIVQNNKHEPEWIGKEVAKRLATLARKTDTLVNYMYQNKAPNPEVSQRLYSRWQQIRNNPRGLRETAFGETSAAYTVNKSEQIRICIRDRSNNDGEPHFENDNTSMFVLLHELAHIMSKTYGHGVEFKRNFAAITRLAETLGVYHPVDYSKQPTNYCGTDITNNAY